MRKLQFWMMAAMLMAFAACKKVEMLPLGQNALLPLAVGNQWEYTDSFITTTSLPSADTAVTTISYEVTRARWVDRLVVDAKGRKHMERLQGWEIQPSYDGFVPFTVVAIGDTIYATGYNRIFWNIANEGCNGIRGSWQRRPTPIEIQAYDGSLSPIVVKPRQVGDSIVTFPAFHEISECNSVGPRGYQGVSYLALFHPLVVTSLSELVPTNVGTFSCINFGSQWWADGVGMVQSYHEGEASFYDDQQRLQTGLLRWKRTLRNYLVN